MLLEAAEIEGKYRERNLNDTRWACKVFLQLLQFFYPEAAMVGKRRIFARPGQLTARMRQAWGIEHLKKDENHERLADDRHHALDAVVVAAISESLLQTYTKENMQAVEQGLSRPFKRFPLPYKEFREEILEKFAKIQVARAEEKKVPGQIHQETIVSVEPETQDVFEKITPEKFLDKKAVKSLFDLPDPASELQRYFKDPQRSQSVIQALVGWHQAGRPSDNLPKGPTGDAIRKIRVRNVSGKTEVSVRKGSAGRGDMVRVDVFSKTNPKGKKQFYWVPIYPHQMMHPVPPCRAIVGKKPEETWPVMDATYRFEYSFYRRSLLEITTKEGEVILGYYMTVDRSAGAIHISPLHTLTSKQVLGAKNLQALRKLTIDRLGNVFPVRKEPRLWHGVPCISVNRPD